LFEPKPLCVFFVGIVTGLPSEGSEYVVFSVTLDSNSVPPVVLSVSVGAGRGGAFLESTPILTIKGQVEAASAEVIGAGKMDRCAVRLVDWRLQPNLLGCFQLRLPRACLWSHSFYEDRNGPKSIEDCQSGWWVWIDSDWGIWVCGGCKIIRGLL
jgi:hypothetical protein